MVFTTQFLPKTSNIAVMDSSSKQNRSLKKVTVQSNNEISPGAFLLSFTRDFIFIPGQVLAITTTISVAPRMYSIASGTRDENIRILYTLKPGGELTPNLSVLKAGDEIFVSEPAGNFYGIAGSSVWIAAGTGIAPFVSMWRSGLTKDKILIHGGRFLHSFYFENEFKTGLRENYIRCCSRETGEGIYHGRLTRWLQEQPALWPDKKYYLCGSAEMVVETRDLLIEKGISYQNIVAEIYF